MTNSSQKTPGPRRTSFYDGRDHQEEDLILADLQVIPDDAQLKITPLQHWIDDEDAIDRLLVNTGFETSTGTKQSDELFIEDINLIDEPSTIEIFNDQLEAIDNNAQAMASVQNWSDAEDPIDKLLVDTGFEAGIEAPKTDEPAIEDICLPDAPADSDTSDRHRDAIISVTEVEPAPITPLAEPVSNADFQVGNFISAYLAMRPDTPTLETEHEVPFNEQTHGDRHPMMDEAVAEALITSETFEPETAAAAHASMTPEPAIFHRADKSRRYHHDNKSLPTATIVYMALAFATTALVISTITLAMMVADMKTEIIRLTEAFEIVKDDMAALSKKSSAATGRSGSVKK